MTEIPAGVLDRLARLPCGLREHIDRAREVGRELAQRHAVEPGLVDLALAAHDLGRALKGEALLTEARRYGLNVHPVEQQTPLLLHGPVAAAWLIDESGSTDGRVIDAVRWHSTGRTGMGPIAKVVFLADKLDPEKVTRGPQLEKVKRLADDSVDGAILEFLDQQLAYLLGRGALIHPASVELRNELLTAQAGGGETGRSGSPGPVNFESLRCSR